MDKPILPLFQIEERKSDVLDGERIFYFAKGWVQKMDHRTERNTGEKITIFRSLFSGLSNAYGTYDLKTGRARQVKEQVTNEVLLAHLTGRRPYGVYLLVKDRTRSVAVDFDTKDQTAPSDFVARARHYGLSAYIERSKSKGYHVWMFFDDHGIQALKARMVAQHILEEIEHPQTEIFPKQDQLDGDMRYGNFINAPLFGPLVLEGKTAFVEPTSFIPYPDQWSFLESVNKTKEQDLDDMIELNDLTPKKVHQPSVSSSKKVDQSTFGLPPCAIKMLRDGVSQFQRVVCFRLAVHLKRLGLPYDMAVAALKTWALKNRPVNGKEVIRESEILDQALYAYNHTYSGYGCNSAAIEYFCETSCSVRQWNESKKRIPYGKGPI